MRRWLVNTSSLDSANQARLMMDIVKRESRMRYAGFAFLLVCYALTGLGHLGIMVIVSAVALDMAFRTYHRRFGEHELLRNMDVCGYVGFAFLSTLMDATMGFIAVLSMSSAVIMTGLLGLMGALIYLSMKTAKMPIFYGVTVAPLGLAMLLYVSIAAQSHLEVNTSIAMWLMPILGTTVLLVNFHNAIRAQRDVEVELDQARQKTIDQMERLEYVANYDDLTGLLNRAAFNGRLAKTFEKVHETGTPVGFLLLDLNEFKPINDCFGHSAGDALLIEASARLVNTVAGRGYVARVGGDEFAIVLAKTSEIETIEDVARDIIRVIQLPVKCGDHDLSVGVSVGAVICDPDLATQEKVFLAADEALYRAKENNKSTVEVYHPSDPIRRVSLTERRSIEDAIKNRLIKPHYQPKFRLATKEVIGFEALARWPVSPSEPSESADFISKIEELGMLGEFTYQMAKQVLQDVCGMIDEGLDPGQVSINLPEATLATSNGMEDLEWLLAENAKAVPHITFEITEDVFIARAGAKIRENIQALRGLGVRVSLDDFGTGFASFQHLRQLEFDEMKIDTAFVAGLGKDRTAEVIVNGFLSIAQGLGVDVVAEGVETKAQLEYLLNRGCHIGQGFIFSKAKPIDVAKQFLVKQNPSEKIANA